MKKYHVISAKNFGYESNLGDGTYDYYVFPANEFSQSDAMGCFVKIIKYTWKNNNEYPYTAYEYRGSNDYGGSYGKQYYDVVYNGLFGENKVPFTP